MNPLFNMLGNIDSSFYISSNSLITGPNIPHIFNYQNNYIENNYINENNLNENNLNENNLNENNLNENGKKELFKLTNINEDINNIIKHTLNQNIEEPNYNFNIEDDSITVNLGSGNGDFNVIKNIMAYLYHKQINGELSNFGNIGEFVVQSYSAIPIQSHYLFENNIEDEKFDYFANCKLINKLVGKAEKIKKDDSLLVNEESCFICFEKYKEKELKRKLPHCNHFFHKKCIDKWLKNKSTCPHCRIDLMDKITLSSEDREEYYKKMCNCDEDEEDDENIQFIEFNLGVIGIHSRAEENVENKEDKED